MGVDRRRKLSHSKTSKHHRFLSVLHLKKSSHRHRPIPIQHFVINDEQSSDTIHTTIQQSGDNISSILSEFNNRNKHSQSTSSILSSHPHNNQPKKSIVSQKSIQFVENKVKPIDATKIQQHDQSVQTPSNNVFNEDSQRRSDSFSTTSNTNSLKSNNDDQRLSVATINSNQLENDNDIAEQKKPSISFEKNFSNKSDHKFQMKKKVQRCSLCRLLVPLISLLVLAAITALVIGLIKPGTDTNLATSSAAIASINVTNTFSTSTSTVSSYITTTTQTTTSALPITMTTTTESTTMGSSTSTSTTTESTISISTTSTGTTFTSATTVSTTSTSTTSTSTAATTESTTSTTTATQSTTSTTTTTEITSTTTMSSMNPCVSGIYWNVNGIIYAGNGTGGSGFSQLSSPSSVFIDANDTLYVTDAANCRILAYLPNATSGSMVAGTGTCGSTLNRLGSDARYNFVDANQNIYVVDKNNVRVVRWVSGGSTGVRVAGNGSAGSSLGQLNYPYGIWVDSNSNVFVADFGNHRVMKWAPGATTGTIVAGQSSTAGSTVDKLSSPADVYYDEINQNLYISNYGSASIMRWREGELNGTVIAGVLGSSGSNSIQLSSPTGITLDQWQNLYVVDRSNNRIQLFCNGNSTGITIAGAGTSGSTFSQAFDIALDSKLNLYVPDSSRNNVMKFFKL